VGETLGRTGDEIEVEARLDRLQLHQHRQAVVVVGDVDPYVERRAEALGDLGDHRLGELALPGSALPGLTRSSSSITAAGPCTSSPSGAMPSPRRTGRL
jgi:hypothetical protein